MQNPHPPITIKPLTDLCYGAVKNIMDLVYPHLGGAIPPKKFTTQITTFPAGQLAAYSNGRLVGASFSFQIDGHDIPTAHTYNQITSNGYLCHHNPKGNTLYGIESVVHPDFRRQGIGQALYRERETICKRLGINHIVVGGRIPNYHHHQETLSAEDYMDAVIQGHLLDPVLQFQFNMGFEFQYLIPNYQPQDKQSGGYAALLRKPL